MPRAPLAVSLVVLLLGACASAPTQTTAGRIAAETDASEAIAGARHVAYWMDVDLDTLRRPPEVTEEEIERLKAVAARLAADAEALEAELESATRQRAEGRTSAFHDQAARRARELRNETLQARLQWEGYLQLLDRLDAAERPPAAPAAPSAPGRSGAWG